MATKRPKPKPMPEAKLSAKTPAPKRGPTAEATGGAGKLAKELEALVGRPLGPTLSALVGLDLGNDCFGGLCSTAQWDATFRRRLEHSQGIVILGEAANGFFGPHRERLGSTADAGPVVYSDKQQLPPELAGRNLAEFLSIWAYVPDFFSLYPSTAEELDSLHAELLEGPDADPDLRTDVEAALKLPGVRRLRSGAELRALLNACIPLARELWPNLEPKEIPPTRTRAELEVEEKKAFRERLERSTDPDHVGQDFETTRLRIRAIEAKALRRLVEDRKAKGSFGGDVDAEVARLMKLSVDDLRTIESAAMG